jgi:hypothetical protein
VRLEDLIVEVRDKQLHRIGQIVAEDLNLEATVIHNNVGNWQVTLPSEHHLADALGSPGAGIVVTGPDGSVLFSGPVSQPVREVTPEASVQGQVIFTGETDDHIVADMLAWPQPSNGDVTTQTVGHDDRTGPAETLMHEYVAANVGPNAPTARRNPYLVMGSNLARGETLTKHARFPVLGSLLNEIAAGQGLGFRVRQGQGQELVFETFAITDRSSFIKLSVENDALASLRAATTAPKVTRAIIGGAGQLEDRKFVEVSNDQSVAAEGDWGRRIEVFIDQRQEDGTDEMVQAGSEALAEGGMTITNVELVPAEDTTMRFGTDWNLGDKVTVVLQDGYEVQTTVNGFALKANADSGFVFGVTLSDALTIVRDSSRVAEDRISNLERSDAVPATAVNDRPSVTFSFATAQTVWSCPHNLGTSPVNIVCFDTNGDEVVGDPTYIDNNTVEIHWFYAFSGSCRIST